MATTHQSAIEAVESVRFYYGSVAAEVQAVRDALADDGIMATPELIEAIRAAAPSYGRTALTGSRRSFAL